MNLAILAFCSQIYASIKSLSVFKKLKGALEQKFVSATRDVDLWNGLDDCTVSVDTITAFKRKLGKLGY